MCVQTFYKLKGNRPVTRPDLLQESLDQCADTVTQKLVSYMTQAEHYCKDSVNGQYSFTSVSEPISQRQSIIYNNTGA